MISHTKHIPRQLILISAKLDINVAKHKSMNFILYLVSSVVEGNIESIILTVLYKTEMTYIRALILHLQENSLNPK